MNTTKFAVTELVSVTVLDGGGVPARLVEWMCRVVLTGTAGAVRMWQ